MAGRLNTNIRGHDVSATPRGPARPAHLLAAVIALLMALVTPAAATDLPAVTTALTVPTTTTTAPAALAAAPAAAPAIVVAPSSGLVDGQIVNVTGSGFANEYVLVTVCAAGAADPDGCDNASAVWPSIDPATSELEANLVVSPILPPVMGSPSVDCRADTCEVVVFSYDDEIAPLARAPITFDPTGPLLPPPHLEVDPTTDLVDGGSVTVTVTGLRPFAFAPLEMCADAGGATHCRSASYIFVDEAGSTTVTTRLPATIADLTTPGAPRIDCRVNLTCRLVTGGSRPSNPVALHFDPTAELRPPPVLQVVPSTDLVDGQEVTVTASGFEPDAYLNLRQCAYDAADEEVGCRWMPGFVTDATGSATWIGPLRARVRSWDGSDPYDCRVVTCRLDVSESIDDVSPAVDLHFDPEAALLPQPTISMSPSGPVVEGEVLVVTGGPFTAGMDVTVMVCRTGTDDCDDDNSKYVTAASDGTFRAELRPRAAFKAWSDEDVDCRRSPGCEVVVSDELDTVRLPVVFGPPPASRGRYLDRVFDTVDVTHDVVYRTTTDNKGNTVDLKMDIYQPGGDTASKRPVVMWMHGGWFAFGDKSHMSNYALASAQRGYVAVSLQYRLRPEVGSHDLLGTVEAAYDAYDDATAAVEWLIANAATYRIDPQAIMVGGYSAGGVLSWNLSYLPGIQGPDRPLVAGAAPIAGIPFAAPEPGDPPIIGFHATNDDTVPVGPGRDMCAEAVTISVVCEWIEYSSGGHGIVGSEFRDIDRRAHDFFFAQVLVPLGYATPPPPPPRPPGSPVRPEIVGPGDGPTTTTTSRPVTTTTVPSPTVPPRPVPTTSPVPDGPTTTTTGTGSGSDPGLGVAVGAGTASPALPRPGRPAYTG